MYLLPGVVLNSHARPSWRLRRVRLGGRAPCTKSVGVCYRGQSRGNGPIVFKILGTHYQGLHTDVSIVPQWSFAVEKPTVNWPVAGSAQPLSGGKKFTSARKSKKNILRGTTYGALQTCLRVKSGQTEHGKALFRWCE